MNNELIEKEDFKRKRIIAILMISITLIFTFVLISSLSQKEFTITFKVDNETIQTYEVEKFDKINSTTVPYKDGYTFLYWACDGKEWDFDNIVARDITLIAVYEKST